MINSMLRTHLFRAFFLIALANLPGAMAGEINARFFGYVEDQLTIYNRDGEKLISITLSEGPACINVNAHGTRQISTGCLTHAFLRSLMINIQSIPISYPINLAQFPGAVCALFALGLDANSPVIPDQNMSVAGVQASVNNEYLMLILNGHNHGNPANSTVLTLIPVNSPKGPSTIKVLISVGGGTPAEYLVQFGSNKQTLTLSRKKKKVAGGGGHSQSDGSATPFPPLFYCSSSSQHSASSDTPGYGGTGGSQYLALFPLVYRWYVGSDPVSTLY